MASATARLGARAADRLGLRAPVLSAAGLRDADLFAPGLRSLRPTPVLSAAGLRYASLFGPLRPRTMSTSSKGTPTPTLLWLESRLNQIEATHIARLEQLHQETIEMRSELSTAVADYQTTIAQAKIKIKTMHSRIRVVAGFLGLSMFYLLTDE